MAALGQDDIGIAFRGFDELEVHGTHGGKVLSNHVVHGPPSVSDVTLQPPNEPDILCDVDEDLDVEQGSNAWVCEQEDPIDDDDIPWLDLHRRFGPRMRRIVVGWFPHDLPQCQFLEVLNQEFGVEGIGVVEVDPPAFVETEVTEVGVVSVLVDERGIDSQKLVNGPGHGCLAGAGAAHHTNHQRSFEHTLAGWDDDSMNRIVTVGNPERGGV